MNRSSRIALLAAVSLVNIACDQITKLIAIARLNEGELHSFLGDTVRLLLAHNYGAFLSLGASLSPGWRQALWSVGVGCVLVVVFLYALFARGLDRPTVIALALIFSGGVSNLYDRIAYGGYVIDFMNVGIGPVRTGIFNIADMAIMAGAFIMLWLALRAGKTENTTIQSK
jgi:signal peptidase II